jgi:hypothetical protein
MAFTVDKSCYGRYLFEYRYDGSEWAMEITARSPDEARERLGALTWARYRGEIAAKIPVPGAGFLGGIAAVWRNFKLIRWLPT